MHTLTNTHTYTNQLTERAGATLLPLPQFPPQETQDTQNVLKGQWEKRSNYSETFLFLPLQRLLSIRPLHISKTFCTFF